MFIRKIVIPLSGRYDPDNPEDLDVAALRAGLEAARRFDAHAEVLCVTGEPSGPDERWSAWLPGKAVHNLISWMEQEGEARRRRARAAFEQVLADFDPTPDTRSKPGPGFSVRFLEQIGDIQETVGAHGRVADLVVIASSQTRWAAPFRPVLEASLRLTACPVLVSPATPPASFASRIAIAWNDSVEAARAVAAALGLLKAAESVQVICCKEDEASTLAPDPLVEYLAWHGIDAKAVMLEAAPRESASAIVDAALQDKSDLLLLGAYIHTRAHSLLFGSVTEFALRDPQLPALLVP